MAMNIKRILIFLLLLNFKVFANELYNDNEVSLSVEELEDKELAKFFDWFFEIGYSEVIFADKVIFYEGDTERLYIRKLLTLEKIREAIREDRLTELRNELLLRGTFN